MKYSVVVPMYNEKGNAFKLYKEVKDVISKVSNSYEIIFVDDGSKDGSQKVLEDIYKKDKKKFKAVLLRKNFGQSAAMDAGIRLAKGDIIITMDGDLQNDPKDIPRMIKKLESGDYDAISGWRYKRKDTFSKRMFSLVSRKLRKIVINDHLHDSGCSLKVYKKECFEDFHLHGEMHRYIAEILALQGFKFGEMKVNHRARKHGKSKYSMTRVIKGFLDLFLVWFWRKYAGRPLHLFGGAGILSIGVGSLAFLYVLILKVFKGVDLSNHFLSIVSVFLILIGVQLFVSGIMSDLLVKNYYKEKRIYKVKKVFK